MSEPIARKVYYSIGEVCDLTGLKPHVLRYWEEQIPMLRPVKRSGGRRYYRPEDVDLVRLIDRLIHHEGYTLRGARLAIEAGSAAAPAAIEVTAAAEIAPTPVRLAGEMLLQLRAIRADLAAALAAA